MLSRYNVCAEEDLRDAMEKVTTYNEAESQRVVTIVGEPVKKHPSRRYFHQAYP